jgi:hypothetical protein
MIAAVAAIITLLSLTAPVRAENAAPGASGYEISLGELNKVKKERPVKKRPKERQKKKNEQPAERPSYEVIVVPGGAGQENAAAPVKVVAESDSKNLKQHVSGSPAVALPVKDAAPSRTAQAAVTVHHDPYSYVIAGKRTTIHTVISSADSIRSVYCRFRSAENGTYAVVTMLPVPGTHFTYSAILPSLASAGRSLLYSIVAVDAAGNEGRSQEFTIAVKPSFVTPGWQLDISSDPIKIRFEGQEKSLEWFSDPGIVVGE